MSDSAPGCGEIIEKFLVLCQWPPGLILRTIISRKSPYFSLAKLLPFAFNDWNAPSCYNWLDYVAMHFEMAV